MKVNFYIFVYIRFPLIIDFTLNPLTSSKLTEKVYIQNTINKELEKSFQIF